MKKTLFALLLATAASANAAPITVTFDYTGAWYERNSFENSYWLPSAMLSAAFTGEDINGNNIIEKNEVTSLIANGIEFTTPNTDSTRYEVRFSYRNTTDYSIEVQEVHTYDYDGFPYVKNFYALWNPTRQVWGSSNTFGNYETWSSTSDTLANVVSSVPEPATVAMLGLGLSVIGLARRRSKASS